MKSLKKVLSVVLSVFLIASAFTISSLADVDESSSDTTTIQYGDSRSSSEKSKIVTYNHTIRYNNLSLGTLNVTINCYWSQIEGYAVIDLNHVWTQNAGATTYYVVKTQATDDTVVLTMYSIIYINNLPCQNNKLTLTYHLATNGYFSYTLNIYDPSLSIS